MKKTIELSKVRSGEVFALDGVAFIKLDEDKDATFVLMQETLGKCPFATEDAKTSNKFVTSNIEHTILSWLSKHKTIRDAALSRPIDLTTMDGMTDYGTPSVMARMLTIDEYRKYRRHIPLTDTPFWLATGWTTESSPYSYAYGAYYVNADGTVFSNAVCDAHFAPRPAFNLKSSIIVSVDCAYERTLDSYAELELLAELQRRVTG